MKPAEEIEQRLRELAEPERVPVLQRFFRTGPGEYGEGDRFLGVRVPALRRLCREYRDMRVDDAADLLQSPYHEARLLALLVLVERYRRGDAALRDRIFALYLDSTARINSWDLVDSSAEHIVGAHLYERDRSPLHRLARSRLLWDRRIAVLATFHFIRRGEFDDTLDIIELLLERGEREDLIHKAAGWMLREIGGRDHASAERFLRQHYRAMPRTMLRYAIEKYPPALRRAYLDGQV